MEEIRYREENDQAITPGPDESVKIHTAALPPLEESEVSAPFFIEGMPVEESGDDRPETDSQGDLSELTDHIRSSAEDDEAALRLTGSLSTEAVNKAADEAEDVEPDMKIVGEAALDDDSDMKIVGGDAMEEQSGDTKEIAGTGKGGQPEVESADEEIPDVRTEISVEELEKKITASTVVTATHPAPPVEKDEEPDDDDDDGGRKRHPVLITVILLLLLAGIVGGAYTVMARHFETHFYSGTVINGRDVSGLTTKEVKQLIADDVSKYTLTIKERDGVKEVLDADDVKWAYVDDHKVDEIMANQDPWKWFLSISRSKTFNVSAGTTYDKDAAIAAVEALRCLNSEYVTEPQDAFLTETPEGAKITPEVNGNKVDEERLKTTVLAALDAADDEIDITDPDLYLYPKIYSNDPDLNRRMNDWNAYLNIEITYTFGDNVETIGRSTISEALSDDGENVTIALDWIRPLVGAWADKYNTFGRERIFKTHSGETVTLPAYTKDTGEKDPDTKEELTHTSDYGWLLDSEATAADLESAIVDRMSGSRQPIFKYSAKGWDNGDLTGTYVEISLEQQHLWVYKDYQVVVETDFVSGLPVPTRATYPGCYAIDAKKSPATLGTMATQGYESAVNWWCPFDGGRGLHDAPWRTVFGGTEYLSNGSHGCVNCPADVMERIYNAVSIGEAVCVY